MVVNPNDFRVQRVLGWLCTPPGEREPRTQKELADELGKGHQYITDLKNDPTFLRLWEERYRKAIGSPERQHEVMKALQETASDRTDPRMVQAARTYLETIDAIKPKKMDITVTSMSARALTDEQLQEMIAQRAEQELLDRQEST